MCLKTVGCFHDNVTKQMFHARYECEARTHRSRKWHQILSVQLCARVQRICRHGKSEANAVTCQFASFVPMVRARLSQCTWLCLRIRLLSKADFRKKSSSRLTAMIGSNSRNCVRQWIIMLGSFSWCAQKFKIRKKWRVALCPEELKNVPRWEKLRWNNCSFNLLFRKKNKVGKTWEN